MDDATIFLNGRFLAPSDEAVVSLFDRGYLLGDSIFETIRAYHGVAFRLDAHLARFEYGSTVTGIPIPMPIDELRARIEEVVALSGQHDAYVRLTLSRGEGSGTVSPAGCDTPTLSIVVRPLHPYPAAAYEAGIETAIVKTRRIPPECIDTGVKAGNYLPSVLARKEIDGAGMIEGVQLGVAGQVVSGTVSNIFIVRGSQLVTPDLASGCLPGVTRSVLLVLAPSAGLTPVETRLAPDDLFGADEAFFSNTLMECLPIAAIDGCRYAKAPGPSTTALLQAYQQLVLNETGARV